MKTAGIDSCKAGWLLISFDNDSGEYRVLRSDEDLKAAFHEFDRVFIDIPIGLNDELHSRPCDDKLRDTLGPGYGALVISPPIRPALHAPTYVEANTQNYEYTGRNLALQAWNITPKIRTVDNFLQQDPSLKEKILESHPELLFMNLNGGGMIYQGKNTKKGLKHRLDLITEQKSAALDMFREIKEKFRRNEIGEVVIADTIALAHGAGLSVDRGLKTLPLAPQTDSKGLTMAIHYI